MHGTTGPRKMSRFWRIRRWRKLMLATAALPLFQTTGCWPDLVGALNFELQSFFNTILIDAANTIIQNMLRL
jgi:hypothetical protein